MIRKTNLYVFDVAGGGMHMQEKLLEYLYILISFFMARKNLYGQVDLHLSVTRGSIYWWHVVSIVYIESLKRLLKKQENLICWS